MFFKKGILKTFLKFTGKHLYRCLFFHYVAYDVIKKETLLQLFPCEFCKILKQPFSGTPSSDSHCIFTKIIFQKLGKLNTGFYVRCTSYIWRQPPGVFLRKVFFKNFPNFTGKHLCESLFFNKVAGLSLQLY